MREKMKVVLASGSPRRKELLEQMGVLFLCCPSLKEEKADSDLPSEVVKQLAFQKAEDVLQQMEGEVLIIGSDTVVAYQEQILGKPKSKEDAFRMLKLLQGQAHMVYTGVALFYQKDGLVERHVFEEHTKVKMFSMTEAEILSYIATKEPMDKAGAYAIQGKGAVFIQGIEGDYHTVVGFPMARVYQELKKMKLADRIFIGNVEDETE